MSFQEIYKLRFCVLQSLLFFFLNTFKKVFKKSKGLAEGFLITSLKLVLLKRWR